MSLRLPFGLTTPLFNGDSEEFDFISLINESTLKLPSGLENPLLKEVSGE